MKTSKALNTIYEQASKKLGPDQARKYLITVFSNIIFDLEQDDDLSAEMIEKKIKEEAEFILRVNKQNVA